MPRPTGKQVAAAAGAVTAAAGLGGLGTDPGSEWYRSLRLPSWQPPSWAFGAVWTPLYATIAWSAARSLAATRGDREARRRYVRLLGTDLALNAGWSWAFFRAHEPRAAVAEVAALDVVNVALVREAARHDRTAALLLAPYAAWCGFATVLSTAIARLNTRSAT
jgi:tryptophan-rich sensory protein